VTVFASPGATLPFRLHTTLPSFLLFLPPLFSYPLKVGVYIVFAFFAAELAHRLGEWRVIVSCAGLWSIAMLALGPFPPLAPYFVAATAGAGTDGGGLGLIVSSLVVLGITETFVFLPFIPLFHRRLQRKLGWAALETEDTVASVW